MKPITLDEVTSATMSENLGELSDDDLTEVAGGAGPVVAAGWDVTQNKVYGDPPPPILVSIASFLSTLL